MNKKLLVTAVALGFSANSASAAPPAGVPLQMQGSDTMREITIDVLASCGIPAVDNPATTGITEGLVYIGTGSGNGGTAMIAGNQQLAPQSRFLSAAECTATNSGQGLQIGLDGIAVFRDTTEGSNCAVVRYAGKLAIQDLNNAATLGYGNGAAGLDDGTGVALADDPATTNCNEAVEYCFTHWADALRIIYTGQHAHVNDSGTTAACTNNPPSASALTTKRCNHDVRRTLVETWANIFDTTNDDGAAGCSDAHCVRLKHAYRRDDRSGTTDTFLQILGAPSLGATFTNRSFCNGIENEDNDVIRRPCVTNSNASLDPDAVCSPIPFANRKVPFGTDGSPTGAPGSTLPVPPVANSTGDLGLVLAISLPAEVDFQYDSSFCTASPLGGSFKYAPMDAAVLLAGQKCPDGTARASGQCRWPVYATGAKAGQFNCKARRTNRPGGPVWANFDGRQYNRVPRHPITGAILQPNATVISDARWSGGGDYRIHVNTSAPSQTATPYANAHPACLQPDATRQLGCLVQADPCSIGYAGLEARDSNSNAAETAILGTNEPLLLRTPLDSDTAETNAGDDTEIEPTVTNIQRLVAAAPDLCIRYPLSRVLWLNSSKGFGGFPSAFPNISNDVDSNDADTTADLNTREQDLAVCYSQRTRVDPILAAHGFFPLPAGYAETSRLRACP